MLGPHFYYDLIRLARKGWPTWLRVLYLVVLLISLTLMHEAQGNVVGARHLAEQARRAGNYALTLIILQDVLILLLLPVYVAGVIVEEKENRTLESLFLTHLTDREMVVGKLGARLLPLGSLILAGFPLLAFMHLAGNVDAGFLVYHEINTLLLLLCGGCVCLWLSTKSQSAFEAISNSYPPLLFGLGFGGILGALACPWILGNVIAEYDRLFGRVRQPVPWYSLSLLLTVPAYGLLSGWLLFLSVRRMRRFRVEEVRRPRRLSGALTLTDNRTAAPAPQRKHRAASRMHPLAQRIRDNALFWKECLKDGTGWSLTARWLLVAIGIVLAPAPAYRLLAPLAPEAQRRELWGMAATLPYDAYFISLAAYALLVMFQTTMTVAGEKEQDTLVFLLLIPEERPRILFYKWLGPFWRNWPVLAISYLGVLLGLGFGLYSLWTALLLVLFPWPFLLMLSALALCLSVLCRRVLYANIVLVAFIAALVIAHVAAAGWSSDLAIFYVTQLFEANFREFSEAAYDRAQLLAVAEQTGFLFLAAACGALALRRFRAV
jgi:ABC-type transport system involved in multi-copper enzyme maturation permease subunit